MKNDVEITDLSKLTPEEKKRWLFRHQKEMLDTFLSHGVITREQYDRSLNGLIEKMGIRDDTE